MEEGRRLNMPVFVLGDFNASVGSQVEGDDPSIIGPHGFGKRNARGEWLVRWATTFNFCISNTFFEAGATGAYTWSNKITRKQIDYCLVDNKVEVIQSLVETNVNVSSDHRCLLLSAKLQGKRARVWKGKAGLPQWSKVDKANI